MSYPSGSTLLVTVPPGASPNTGPFDIYLNSIAPTNLIANDIAKSTLMSPGTGYTFMTPLETFRVWLKSDSTITTANVAILGDVPGFNRSIRVTGSYDSSLNAGLVPAEVFLDCGYGMQTAGTIPTNLNTCPSTIGTGTSSINSSFNTLVTVKASETGSDYIRFFPNGAPSSVFYHYIGTDRSVGTDIETINICVDLAGGAYQTTPTNSINVYPVTSFPSFLSKPANFINSAPYGNDNGWLIVKANGQTIYSSSAENFSPNTFSTPGNAIVEVTSSVLQSSLFGFIGVRGNFVTNSLTITGVNPDGTFPSTIIYSSISSTILTASTDVNQVAHSFPAVPGFSYTIQASQVGNLIYAFRQDGSDGSFTTRTLACNASVGGSTVYSFWSSPTVNTSTYWRGLTSTALTTPLSIPSGRWINLVNLDNQDVELPIQMNGNLAIGYSGPCP